MSGIGTKAGGTDYLLQFVLPRTITENTLRRGFAPPPPIAGRRPSADDAAGAQKSLGSHESTAEADGRGDCLGWLATRKKASATRCGCRGHRGAW